MPLASGTKLGQYEIQSPLGAGGMGEVYRARDPQLKRDVAIKVITGYTSHDADRLRRFEQEARAAAALNQSECKRLFTTIAKNAPVGERVCRIFAIANSRTRLWLA
jgi:serine/threonine protein kinase